MKEIKIIIGIAEIFLAVLACVVAVYSNHPMAWYGYVLGAMFGVKGVLYIMAGSE